MTSDLFLVRFRGVRGSLPAMGPDTVRYGGNTPCVEVRIGDAVLIVDAGTGIRALGEDLAAAGMDAIDLLLTHFHYDHVAGLPFFRPFNRAGTMVRLWSGHTGEAGATRAMLRDLMRPPFFPIGPESFAATLEHRDFAAGDSLAPAAGIRVRTTAMDHPGGAIGYRIEHGGRAFCHLSDTEHRDAATMQRLAAFAAGADVLLWDATYTDAEYPAHVGWGHSTWEAGVALATVARVGRLVLFHHHPARADAELDAIGAAAVARFPATIVAAEGLELHL